MTIFDHFPGITLTPDQCAVLEALQAFAGDGGDARVFVLRGYAGTGKTFLMQGLAAWLQAQERVVVFAAPTNRAAKVLQYRTGTEVQTLHRLLYEYKDGQHCLAARPDYFGEAPVLVVDEASLLGDHTPDDADMRFGSGRLLSDLFAFFQPGRYPRARIIFCGDPAQLPPVGMRYSPALSEANLRRLSGAPVLSAELTRVVRQQEGNGILGVAHAMRAAIAGRDFQPRLPLERNAEVRLANGPVLLDKYFERSPNRPSGRQIILAHSNEAIAAYNRAARERYFPDAAERLAEGDFLLVTNNLYGTEPPLTNGELVQVVHAGRLEKRVEKAAPGNFRPAECRFMRFTEREMQAEFHFRDVRVALRDAGGQVRYADVKVLENWLLADELNFPPAAGYLLKRIAYNRFYENNRALYRENNELFKHLRKDYLRTDPYANALLARFGYAVTVHKAQGGEWDFVYVDMCAQMPRDSADFYRWSYTAITRAKKKAYLRLKP